MKKISVSVLLIFVVLLTSQKSVYADCALVSTSRSYKESDVVVIGTAMKTVMFQPIQSSAEYGLGTLIKQEKVLKGKAPKKLVIGGNGNEMESIEIKKGKSYLLYLTKSDNHYQTKACYADRELTEKEKKVMIANSLSWLQRAYLMVGVKEILVTSGIILVLISLIIVEKRRKNKKIKK